MTDNKMGVMLLSHNFDIAEDTVPKLNRDEFAEVFAQGLSKDNNINSQQLGHPHWMVKISFAVEQISPLQVGELCVQALMEKRQHQVSTTKLLPSILFLAGKKTTPPLSDNPESLQTGQWGVDVVETNSVQDFLCAIGWQEKTANQSENLVFKVEYIPS